jgi:hypothetical protein
MSLKTPNPKSHMHQQMKNLLHKKSRFHQEKSQYHLQKNQCLQENNQV